MTTEGHRPKPADKPAADVTAECSRSHLSGERHDVACAGCIADAIRAAETAAAIEALECVRSAIARHCTCLDCLNAVVLQTDRIRKSGGGA